MHTTLGLIVHLGVLNLIFFHRYFPSIRPITFDVLDFTLPAINDADLETLIDSRVSALTHQHVSAAGAQDGKVGGGGVRGRIAVEFYEKKRRRSNMWFGGLAGKGDEEVCWEIWTLDVTIATPRTESGMSSCRGDNLPGDLHVLIECCRTSEGPQGDGQYVAEGCVEDPRGRK